MVRRRRKRRDADSCEEGGCGAGGSCVRVAGRAGGPGGGAATSACACAGAWGGVRCSQYVGHDHACGALACPPPALCVWADHDGSGAEAAYCACPVGATCVAPRDAAPPPRTVAPGGTHAGPAPGGGASGAGGAGVAVGVVALVATVLAALFLLYRRRRSAFVHARLADNVEINNPMYLAGDDEPPAHRPHPHASSNNHFANPVYESLYEPQQSAPTEEHANLLAEGSAEGSPPLPERAALL